ncbi:MAG: 2-oxoacid:acceptor oxidoreductase subunit alpha [Candidatus Thermoplasmatota archaeon]|jgi:2-oxoglutarate/2-oxoacid ferredoxin oxidoreductase subunit alpha|nr:2-oxoacid:acceptor oxidoreductase subunit alpha [Candidatus Thermoplasmatota archaeon]
MHRYQRDPNRIRKVLGNSIQFMQGDMACVYGGLLAGCSFFGGYPITPATEIAEGMSSLLPKVGGMYLQMEDEIASIAAIIGASWAGAKSMTATSSPGFSLMMENYGYAAMTETPCVIVNVQRGGPSTGLPTLGSQGDMMQARWGTHGDFEPIALCPTTVQECLDLTVESFNLAERYRTPVCLMMDGEIGYLHARIVIPPEESLTIVGRRQGDPRLNLSEKVPLFPTFGHGYHMFITGLTHDVNGLPATFDQKEHERLITRLTTKITDDREKLTMVERTGLDDAEVAFVSYGASARPAMYAVNRAREQGIKAGILRLKLIWPFPIKEIEQLSETVKTILVPEMNLGQIVHAVREYAVGNCNVISLPKIGGETHHPQELLNYLYKEVQ